MWLHKTVKFKPHSNQKVRMENNNYQNGPSKILNAQLRNKKDILSSLGQKEMSSESPQEFLSTIMNDAEQKSDEKEEKIVIQDVRSLAEEAEIPFCSMESNKLKISNQEVQNSENAGEVKKDSVMNLEDVSKVPSYSRGGILNGSVSDDNVQKTKLPKRKTSKDSQLQIEQKPQESPEQNSLDGIKSPPTSPLNESSEYSRRTRCSFNPNFAEKQKKFLAMVSSSSWDDDESHDGDFYEHSFKNESKDSLIDDEASIDSTSKSNDVNGKSPIRRGRPTKEVAQRKSSESLRRKSARFDPSSEKNAVKTSANEDEDTLIIDDKDRFCWTCHRVDRYHASVQCVTCPRVYHIRCIRGQCESAEKDNWSCPECTLCLKMESFENQSESMKLISADEFCLLLTRTVEFLSSLPGAEVFREPVDSAAFPEYRDYIVNPVNLKKIQANIDKKLYGSTESFIADIKWLHHNSIIFNGVNSGLSTVAKSILQRCKSKMNQLERCVDCFKQSFDVSISESFLDACRQPHLLVWAKFKGYPFWPSKVFHWKMDNKNNCIVEVKFFNDYSRAWVPSKSVYLFSKKSPSEVSLPNSKDYKNYQNALAEVQKHISNLEDSFGTFVYAPTRTEFNHEKYNEHLKSMLPKYDPLELQARNTIISSVASNKIETSSDQDFGNKSWKEEPRRIRESDLKPEENEKTPSERVEINENNFEPEGNIKKPFKRAMDRESDNEREENKKKRTKRVKVLIKESGLVTEKGGSKKKRWLWVNEKDLPPSLGLHPSIESDSKVLKGLLSKYRGEKHRAETTSNAVEKGASIPEAEILSEDYSADSFDHPIKRRLSDSVEDLVTQKKKFSPNTKDTQMNSELAKMLQSNGPYVSSSQISSDYESLNSLAPTTSSDEFSSKKSEKKKNFEHSGLMAMQDKYPNLANEYGSESVRTQKTMEDLAGPKFRSAETNFEEGASRSPSARSQSMYKKDFPQNTSSMEKSSPASRKRRVSSSRDSSRTSSSEPDDGFFSSISERPIGMETEARSLRVNPVSFDHEGSATRLFNFSVQQLVPLVSEALSNMMNKLASTGNKDALISILRLQVEELQQKHVQEITNLKRVINEQIQEYAHTNSLIQKQTEQKWMNRVAELEESLKKEKEMLKAERENWKFRVAELTTLLEEVAPKEAEIQESK